MKPIVKKFSFGKFKIYPQSRFVALVIRESAYYDNIILYQADFTDLKGKVTQCFVTWLDCVDPQNYKCLEQLAFYKNDASDLRIYNQSNKTRML